jgi:hypothetical protein
MHKQMCPQKCFKTCIPKPVQICSNMHKQICPKIIKMVESFFWYQKLHQKCPSMHTKTCPKICPTCIQNDYHYQTYMTIYINNISTFASQTYMIQICLNMSINYFTQTKSPTTVTYKLPKKTLQSKKKTSQKNYGPKNKPLQHWSHTNHYIPKKKSMSKKKINDLLFFYFDSIIYNPFSMERTILFPLAAVEDVATTPLSATYGVLGVNPTTFPHVSLAAIDLAVRSIKTAG